MPRRIATVLCVLLLLALFVFPEYRLRITCTELEQCAQQAAADVLNENWDAASTQLLRMLSVYEQEHAFLHSLLSHSQIESLERGMHGVAYLIQVEDQPQTLLELAGLIVHARYLKNIECLHLFTLL